MIALQWSKTKSTLESFLCDKLKGRIKIFATVYRKSHDGPARVWMTLDKKEIVNASDVTYAVRHEELYKQLKQDQNVKEIPYHSDWGVMFHSKERQELVKASHEAEEIMKNQNVFNSYHLYSAFMDYCSLSIEQALNSENVMIRAYAMLDRRVGKRRLKELTLNEATHPLIVDFYYIRCEVEGLTP